jgi:NAD(P)-dependent dehydrogenase (short-subunit alcohol dehydrogenase family)
METNFFGALWGTQAVLPILRAQGSGHLIQISTTGGIAAFPTLGGYHASKWALEGLSESLAQEVAGFGIKVTLVEPGWFDTDWLGSSAVLTDPNPVYEEVKKAVYAVVSADPVGDPEAASLALLQIVDAEQPPPRVLFGSSPHPPRAKPGRPDQAFLLAGGQWHTWGCVLPGSLGPKAQGPPVILGVTGPPCRRVSGIP